MIKHYLTNQKGYVALTTVLFFIVITAAVISGVVIPATNQIRSVNDLSESKQSYISADNMNEDALYRLKTFHTLPSTLSLPFSNGTLASASVTTQNNQTQILSTGAIGYPVRYVKTLFSSNPVTSFAYAAQVGDGGFYLAGGSSITGSIYSNGPITSDGSGPVISANATVANTTAPTIDQTNSYTNGTSPVSVLAGNTASTQDVAQSFKVSTTTPLTYIRFYLKKTLNGTPGNATVRIVPDLSGKPSNTGTVGTGTLNTSTVTTSFTYVTVPIVEAPVLTPGTTYWIVIDNPATSGTTYLTMAATNNTYTNGVAMSGSWNSNKTKNTWSAVSPANSDLYFDLYVGGLPNTLSGAAQYNRIIVRGDAWANTINSASVTGTAYCKFNTYLYDQNNAVKNCDGTRADPTPLDMPISDTNIANWKAAATAGGVINGDYNLGGGLSASMGPKKIVGNLNLSGGSTLSLTGIVWVTGKIMVSGGSVLKLASSYGSADGLIISDGRIAITGGSYMKGSGTTGSFFAAVTTSQCPTSGDCSGDGSGNAIDMQGGSGSVVAIAPYGTFAVQGGAMLNSVVAKRVIVDGGSNINYTTGLTSMDFFNTNGIASTTSGWKVDDWEEVTQ